METPQKMWTIIVGWYQYLKTHTLAAVALIIILIIVGVLLSIPEVIVDRIFSTSSQPKFSSNQTMRLYGPHEINFINLDNSGTLRPYVYIFKGFKPNENISLVLNATPSILGKEYMPNENGRNGGRVARHTQIFEEKDLIIFNILDKRVQDVKTSGRTFVVTLLSIKDLNDENFEYQFGIVEK